MAKETTPANPFLAAQSALLLEILQRIQKIDSEFPIQYLICLVVVSQDEGCSITNLAEKSGLALSTVSRIVGALSDYRQLGQPYGFIDVRISEKERRRKELYLTDLGREALKNILQPLENLP
jgi:DNA-binding MarR family transcriptional regulator